MDNQRDNWWSNLDPSLRDQLMEYFSQQPVMDRPTFSSDIPGEQSVMSGYGSPPVHDQMLRPEAPQPPVPPNPPPDFSDFGAPHPASVMHLQSGYDPQMMEQMPYQAPHEPAPMAAYPQTMLDPRLQQLQSVLDAFGKINPGGM